MAILASRSHPGHFPLSEAEPVNITSMIQQEQGTILRDGRFIYHPGMMIWPLSAMPPNVLALISPNVPQTLLARRLFPPMPEQALVTLFARTAGRGGGVERLTEHSKLVRFLLAVAFVRWYCWDEALSAEHHVPLSAVSNAYQQAYRRNDRRDRFYPDRQYAIGFAPVAALPRWTFQHGELYTLMWNRVAQLMAPRAQLRAQTRQWMQTSIEPPVELLSTAVHETGRRMGAISPQQAEAMYFGYLSNESRAPLTLVRSRMESDWTISSLDVWRAVSETLIGEFPELALWRADLAMRQRCAERDLVLWLLEPAELLWPAAVV